MSKPTAVLISDIHYSLPTLELADAAMRQAIAKANELKVPLIVAGDLHDTKANLRGECVNSMIETFKQCNRTKYILIGNHDRINEKSPEHSLNFLRPYVEVIDTIQNLPEVGMLYPYFHDPGELRYQLNREPANTRIIMHQGIEGSNSGDYIQDKSAIMKDDVMNFRVISGHYHCRQDIKTGPPRRGAVGLWSYIGSPYTMNFGEANDPPKGFQVLMSDGSLYFIPTSLRKHIKIKISPNSLDYPLSINPEDLIWVQLKGPKEWLAAQNKKSIAEDLQLTQDFRLELLPTDSAVAQSQSNLSQSELLDSIIGASCGDETSERLKALWRSLCE